MSRPRDTQREKLYRTERAFPHFKANRIESVPEIQQYVDAVIASAWFKRRWAGVKKIRVTDGRSRRCGAVSEIFGGAWRMMMPHYARREMYILHEIAHTTTRRDEPWHGREFVRNYLSLVEWKFGKEVADEFKVALKANGVKWRAPQATVQAPGDGTVTVTLPSTIAEAVLTDDGRGGGTTFYPEVVTKGLGRRHVFSGISVQKARTLAYHVSACADYDRIDKTLRHKAREWARHTERQIDTLERSGAVA